MLIKRKKDFEAAIAQLSQQDERIKFVIDHYGLMQRGIYSSYFEALSKAIIYQQLAGKVAATICGRFINLFGDVAYPTPEQVVKMSVKKLRTAGLSERKAEYIKGIAKSFMSDNWSPRTITKMTDDEIREKATQLKGIGVWTADMFLMNCLRRSDILPVDDYGIKQGFKLLFNKKEIPEADFMIKKAKVWQPYRSVACYYLWSLANDGISLRKLKAGNSSKL